MAERSLFIYLSSHCVSVLLKRSSEEALCLREASMQPREIYSVREAEMTRDSEKIEKARRENAISKSCTV